MTCADDGLLHACIDEDLPPLARQVVSAHLRACEPCRRSLAELHCTRRLLQRLPRENMPVHLADRLLAAFRARPHRRHADPARTTSHFPQPSILRP
jgi:anti-sigma factor RsiW